MQRQSNRSRLAVGLAVLLTTSVGCSGAQRQASPTRTSRSALADGPQLEVVATFTDTRPGNVAVTPAGHIIVTQQPLDGPALAAVEVLPDGTVRPFPSREWASAPDEQGVGISASIGVASDKSGVVWILDMGSSTARPQLVAWDTSSDRLHAQIEVPADVVVPSSFLQDFVLDERRGLVYIADMTFPAPGGQPRPAFIVVDTASGEARRVLEGADALMPVRHDIVVNGSLVGTKTEDGTPFPWHMSLNPIAIDPEFEWVYFGTVNGTDVFRVPAGALADPTLTDTALESRIERYASKTPCDGIAVDTRGRVFVTDIEGSAIGIATPAGYERLVQDPELLAWPDGFALAADGHLYITQNQLYANPALNEGIDESSHLYHLLRVQVD